MRCRIGVLMNTALVNPSLVTIAEAAERTGFHRRTIERWIGAGLLTVIVSEADRRKRLVNLSEVEALAHASARHRRPDPPPSPEREIVSPKESEDDAESGLAWHSIPSDWQEVIDNILQLIYSYDHRVVSMIYPDAFRSLSLDQLRRGPCGRHLLHLARLADGQIQEPAGRVEKTVDSVLQLLFWPAAADDYVVPREFWDTDIGRMLSRAKYQAYKPEELLSIGQAADRLSVVRPTVYRWMDEGTLRYVRDDETGRTYIVRRDFDQLMRLANRG